MLMEWNITLMKYKFILQLNIKFKENILIWKFKFIIYLHQELVWKMELSFHSLLKMFQELMLLNYRIGIYLTSLIQEYLLLQLSFKSLWMFGNSCMEKKIIINKFLSLIGNIWDLEHPHHVKKISSGLFTENQLNKDQLLSAWSEMLLIHQEKLHTINAQIMMDQIENYNH